MTGKITRQFKYEVREMDSETGIFEGYASTFGNLIPWYNEIVMPGAFEKTIKETKGGKVPIFKNHNIDAQIGLGLEAEEDKKGLRIRGKILKDDVQDASETWALMKLSLELGVPHGISIGFQTIQDKIETVKSKKIRYITEIKWHEYSPTPLPANPKARLTNIREMLDDMNCLNHDEVALLHRHIDSLSRAVEGVSEPFSDEHSTSIMTLFNDEFDRLERAANKLREPLPKHSIADVMKAIDLLTKTIEVNY